MVSQNLPRVKSLIFAGAARLPRVPSQTQNESLVVEMGVDRTTLTIESVHVSPPLGGLKGLLESALVGEPMSNVAGVGQNVVKGSYFSPYRSAVRSALLQVAEAFTRFQKDEALAGRQTDWHQAD